MQKQNRYRWIAGLVCVGGIVLTAIGWMQMLKAGSSSELQSFFGPLAACVGLAFVLFRPSDASDSIVPPEHIGSSYRPRYPKPPLAVRVLVVLGVIGGLANWYAMLHYVG